MHFRALVLVFCLFATGSAIAADDMPGAAPAPKGMWLVTDYPAVAVRSGETATIPLKVQNSGMAPDRLELSITGLPSGWKANLFGNGQPINAVMPAPNQIIKLDLRVEVPQDQASGRQTFTVQAKGGTTSLQLPLQVNIGGELPAKLDLKPKIPSLRGTPTSSFDFEFTLRNDSGRSLLVSLAADAPPTFRPSFTETYGSQQLTSVPLDAGATKDLKLKVEMPSNTTAGKYDLSVRANSQEASVTMPLNLEVSGKATLRLSGKTGKISAEAEAGKTTTVDLEVTNDGTAPAEEVEMNATPPGGWKIEFDNKKIGRVEPGAIIPVVASVTPPEKAIAGDYMTNIKASSKGDSSAVDLRVAVTTSTIWGMVGVAIIAIALLVLVGAVGRFGRR